MHMYITHTCIIIMAWITTFDKLLFSYLLWSCLQSQLLLIGRPTEISSWKPQMQHKVCKYCTQVYWDPRSVWMLFTTQWESPYMYMHPGRTINTSKLLSHCAIHMYMYTLIVVKWYTKYTRTLSYYTCTPVPLFAYFFKNTSSFPKHTNTTVHGTS